MRMLMWVGTRFNLAIRPGGSGLSRLHHLQYRGWGQGRAAVSRRGSTIWLTALRRLSRRQMPMIRTDRRHLVSRQQLMDFKTPRVVKIGCLTRIQGEADLRGDGKMLMGTCGVRLDRVAGRTAIHTGTYKDRAVSMETYIPVGNTGREISQRSL